jgi:hypothetical protein
LTNYVMFGRPTYGADDGNQFELTISRNGIYCMADMTRPVATELLDDIRRHLEIDPGRTMEEGDLGLAVPEDLPF